MTIENGACRTETLPQPVLGPAAEPDTVLLSGLPGLEQLVHAGAAGLPLHGGRVASGDLLGLSNNRLTGGYLRGFQRVLVRFLSCLQLRDETGQGVQPRIKRNDIADHLFLCNLFSEMPCGLLHVG